MLGVFLPYPIVVNSAQVTLHQSTNSLQLKVAIDKSWDTENADCGSAPWLLAQALKDDDFGEEAAQVQNETPKPKSLAEMFQLEEPNAGEPVGFNTTSTIRAAQPAKWDPVDEDEELPEDRFHRKDMMSMHILEARKAEREQKAKESDAKRKTQRVEVQEKQRRAKEAGKTWREMYPNEPETTYIDMEDILDKQKARQAAHSSVDNVKAGDQKPPEKPELLPTDDAISAAAAWSENKQSGKLDLRSALAFDLLD